MIIFNIFSWIFDKLYCSKALSKIAMYDYHHGPYTEEEEYSLLNRKITLNTCSVTVLFCDFRQLTFKLPVIDRRLFLRDVTGSDAQMYRSGIWLSELDIMVPRE
jgi:hypothetical protein